MMKARLLLLMLLTLFYTVAQGNGQGDTCPPLTTRLQPGDLAQVTSGTPNRLRAEASTNAKQLGLIAGGDIVTVLLGFKCADDALWWQVDYQGTVGWTVEIVGNDYALVALPSSNSSDVGDIFEYERIQFNLPDSILPEQIRAIRLPERLTSNLDLPYQPESIQFLLDNDKSLLAIYPLNGFMQIEPSVAGAVGWLAQMLYERPSLLGDYCLPFPNYFGARQDIALKGRYIENEHLQGIAYLTRFSQQWQPYSREDFIYTFQGFYDDYYVSMTLPVKVSLLPDIRTDLIQYDESTTPQELMSAFRAEVDTLWQLRDEEVIPSMDSLDAVMQSLIIPPDLFASNVTVDMNTIEPMPYHNCYPGLTIG